MQILVCNEVLADCRRRSAKREAVRKMMVRKRIARDMSPAEFLDPVQHGIYHNLTRSIEGTFRGYSLHCGGIVVLNSPIPDQHRVHHTSDFKGSFAEHQVCAICTCASLNTCPT